MIRSACIARAVLLHGAGLPKSRDKPEAAARKPRTASSFLVEGTGRGFEGNALHVSRPLSLACPMLQIGVLGPCKRSERIGGQRDGKKRSDSANQKREARQTARRAGFHRIKTSGARQAKGGRNAPKASRRDERIAKHWQHPARRVRTRLQTKSIQSEHHTNRKCSQ